MESVTCQVFNTRNNNQHGPTIPATAMKVVLRCISFRSDASLFSALTNAEGEITHWPNWKSEDYTLDQYLKEIKEESTWQMGFDLNHYFGPGNTSYNWVDINFFIKPNRTYHLSLHVSPYEYRTCIAPWPLEVDWIGTSTPFESSIGTKRRCLSKDQQSALMQHYINEPYPESEMYAKIANHLNLDKKRVQRWFCTTRSKLKYEVKVSVSGSLQKRPPSSKGFIQNDEDSSSIDPRLTNVDVSQTTPPETTVCGPDSPKIQGKGHGMETDTTPNRTLGIKTSVNSADPNTNIDVNTTIKGGLEKHEAAVDAQNTTMPCISDVDEEMIDSDSIIVKGHEKRARQDARVSGRKRTKK